MNRTLPDSSSPVPHQTEDVAGFGWEAPRLGGGAIEADAASYQYLQDIADPHNIPEDQAEAVRLGLDAWHERVEHLQDVRAQLGALELYQSDQLDAFINHQDDPYLQQTRVEADRPGEAFSWVKWLSAEATDEQLMDFLKWHNSHIEAQQQSEAFQEMVERERAQYIDTIRKGVEAGKLHPDALTYAIPRAQSMRVVVGDFFDTHIQGRGAYHWRGTDFIVIAPDTPQASLQESLSQSFGHEMNHAVLGSLTPNILDEALTEFIDQASKTGDWDITKGSKTYVEEIGLLRMLSQFGKQQIPIELFTQAYSANARHNPAGRRAAIQQLATAIDAAWGPGVSTEIRRLGFASEQRALGKDPAAARQIHLDAIYAIQQMLEERLQQSHLEGVA